MADGTVPGGLPALDRDVLKLLFRNLLAQKAVRNYAGTYIAKLAAINKVSLVEIGHVTRRYRMSILTSHGMTLTRDSRESAIVVTATQFVWLVRWDMLHFSNLMIACRNAREWQAFVEYFKIPSLDALFFAVPLHKPRKLTDTSAMDLTSDIVKLNGSSIKGLYRVPVWELSEPLPPLHLKQFSYAPWSWDNNLSNEIRTKLSACVVDELLVILDRGCPEDQVALDVFAEVNVKKIMFFPGYADLGQFLVAEGTTNEHRKRRRGGHDLSELQQVGEYLASDPSMPSLTGHVNLTFVPRIDSEETRGWTAENVLDEYDWVQVARDVIARVPPQLRARASVDATFHRAGDAQTKEADELAKKLGFHSESFVKPYGLGVAYHHEVKLSPARTICVDWTVYERKW
ncbi:hypothetical protein AAVH_18707 [Aphelenchoides avenae]|nr:hypothetical protein AAVH_18707 [Aphelenchus avenae]